MRMRIVMVSCLLIPCAITCPSSAFLYHSVRYGFQIVCPTNPGKEIDESSGDIGAIVTQLGGFVIPRENMMIIMPAFTDGADGDAEAVGGTDGAAKKKQ